MRCRTSVLAAALLLAACGHNGFATFTVNLLAPAGPVQVGAGQVVQIVYVDNDPQGQATTSLFADEDGDLQTTGDQVVIDADRPQGNGATQTVDWDTTNAPPAVYQIVAMMAHGQTVVIEIAPGRATVMPANTPPTLAVALTPCNPAGMVTRGSVLDIEYTDDDPDDVASTSVFADVDGDLATTGDQITIATGRPEADGAAQTVRWDTQGAALNTYRIVARTDDGVNPSVSVTASLAITLVSSQPFLRRGGGPAFDSAGDVATLHDGSSVVVGSFQSATITFGATTLTKASSSTGTFNLFLVRYNPDGSVAWARREASGGSVGAASVTTFPDCSTVVAGSFQGSPVFGEGEPNETTLTAVGASDIFLARYEPDGSLRWVRRAGGADQTNGDGAGAIAGFADGSFVVTGSYELSATFGEGEPAETTLVSEGGSDVFVARYDADGTLAWVRTGGGDRFTEAGTGIASFPDGSCVVTGNAFGTFGTTGVAGEFLARYDAAGTLAWARVIALPVGFDRVTAKDVAGFADGTFVVTGLHEGSVIFGAGEANETTLVSAGGEDAFVARYRADGTLDWVRGDGGTATESGHAIATFADGSFVVTGRLLSFDPAATHVFGAGETNETALPVADFMDIYVARYHVDGTLDWVRSDGGPSMDTGTAVATFSDGSCIVAGDIGATATFSAGQPEETTLTAVGEPDIFVAHLDADGKL